MIVQGDSEEERMAKRHGGNYEQVSMYARVTFGKGIAFERYPH